MPGGVIASTNPGWAREAEVAIVRAGTLSRGPGYLFRLEPCRRVASAPRLGVDLAGCRRSPGAAVCATAARRSYRQFSPPCATMVRSQWRSIELERTGALNKHSLKPSSWKRFAGGAAVGTAVAAGLLLSGSVPSLARGVPAGAGAKASTPTSGGYWLVSSDGAVSAYGGAATFGDMAGKRLNAPIVGIVAAPDGKGYWLVAKDGGVFAFGSARFYNSLPGLHHPATASVVGMATVPRAGVPGAGVPGATGPAGPAGPPGASGATGATGPGGPGGGIGPQGPVGVPGSIGPQGPAGATGAVGPEGPAGATGGIGATGPAGAQGATGPQGVPGIANVEVVESAPTQSTGQSRVEDVSCPTGMLATGGGGSIIPLDNSQPLPQLTESQPVGSQTAPTTWEVAAWSAVPSAQWELFIYVMCATVDS
jgi:hypothetical protein